MSILNTRLLLFVALLMLCLTQASQAVDRPFKGKAEGVISFTSPTTAIAEYTGKATHLGKFTRTEYLTIDGPFVYGNIVFTAANGDKLNLDFVGMFVSANDVEGLYTFDGGTGRFSDATGTAEFSANTSDFVNVTVTFSGTIDY
jgi:hypothetical protein